MEVSAEQGLILKATIHARGELYSVLNVLCKYIHLYVKITKEFMHFTCMMWLMFVADILCPMIS